MESAVTAVRSPESAATAVRSPEGAVTACVVARDEAKSGAPTARHFEEGGSRGRRLLAQRSPVVRWPVVRWPVVRWPVVRWPVVRSPVVRSPESAVTESAVMESALKTTCPLKRALTLPLASGSAWSSVETEH